MYPRHLESDMTQRAKGGRCQFGKMHGRITRNVRPRFLSQASISKESKHAMGYVVNKKECKRDLRWISDPDSVSVILSVFCAKNLPNILRKYIAKTKYILNISFQNGHHFRIGWSRVSESLNTVFHELFPAHHVPGLISPRSPKWNERTFWIAVAIVLIY